MAKSSTTISKGSRKELPARGKGKKSLMLEAIKSVCGDEQEFLRQVVAIGMGGVTKISADDAEEEEFEYKQPNVMLLNLVLNRIEPPLKAIAPLVDFEFTANDKPHKQAADVLNAMASGKIPSDIGNVFIQSIKSMIDIEEYTDLKERLISIEQSLGINNE